MTTKSTEGNYPGGGSVRYSKDTGFEQDLLTAGASIIESLPLAVFDDKQELIDACMYLGWLEMWNEDGNMKDEINLALYKINGTMAVHGRARAEATQAHVGIYFPETASKDDKKRLEKMQIQRSHDHEEDESNH